MPYKNIYKTHLEEAWHLLKLNKRQITPQLSKKEKQKTKYLVNYEPITIENNRILFCTYLFILYESGVKFYFFPLL